MPIMGDTDMHLFSLWHASIIMNLVPVCTMCMGRLCETTQRHGSFAWAVAWRCATCHVHFYCCDRTCGPKTRQITAFASHDQLVRHHRRQHKRRLVSDDAEVDFGDDLLDVPESPRGSIPFPMDAFNMFGAHAPAKRFFDDLQARSFGAAVQGLVARSCFSDARVLDPADTGISVADLTLFFSHCPTCVSTWSETPTSPCRGVGGVRNASPAPKWSVHASSAQPLAAANHAQSLCCQAAESEQHKLADKYSATAANDRFERQTCLCVNSSIGGVRFGLDQF